MTMLYLKSLFNEACYKGPSLYLSHFCKTIFHMCMLSYLDSLDRNFPTFLNMGPDAC